MPMKEKSIFVKKKIVDPREDAVPRRTVSAMKSFVSTYSAAPAHSH